MFIILQIFFHNMYSFENWGIFFDFPQFKLGNIRSRDQGLTLQPIQSHLRLHFTYIVFATRKTRVVANLRLGFALTDTN